MSRSWLIEGLDQRIDVEIIVFNPVPFHFPRTTRVNCLRVIIVSYQFIGLHRNMIEFWHHKAILWTEVVYLRWYQPHDIAWAQVDRNFLTATWSHAERPQSCQLYPIASRQHLYPHERTRRQDVSRLLRHFDTECSSSWLIPFLQSKSRRRSPTSTTMVVLAGTSCAAYIVSYTTTPPTPKPHTLAYIHYPRNTPIYTHIINLLLTILSAATPFEILFRMFVYVDFCARHQPEL